MEINYTNPGAIQASSSFPGSTSYPYKDNAKPTGQAFPLGTWQQTLLVAKAAHRIGLTTQALELYRAGLACADESLDNHDELIAFLQTRIWS